MKAKQSKAKIAVGRDEETWRRDPLRDPQSWSGVVSAGNISGSGCWSDVYSLEKFNTTSNCMRWCQRDE